MILHLFDILIRYFLDILFFEERYLRTRTLLSKEVENAFPDF